MTERRVCTYCVMDTSDPGVFFDAQGRCNRCKSMDQSLGVTWFRDDSGRTRLDSLLAEVRQAGQASDYDCILGLSGGVDSSYVALKLHDWGIRPLVVHVDAGWNSELAVRNIQSILEYCNWDLHTHVVNWEDMRRLQIAYLRSGVANQDVPQDHAFFASLYHFATENSIKYVVSGGNAATEGIEPSGQHAAMDARNIRAIWKRFGDGTLHDYPLISFFQYYFYYPQIKRLSTVKPLNYTTYRKVEAERELRERIGYRPYARKHGESVFTRYFQNFYLPTRFGIDKRRPHFSSMIVSAQMTRERALEMLREPLYEPDELQRDQDYLIRKLRMSEAEFEECLNGPLRSALEFPNWDREWRSLKRIQRTAEKFSGRRFNVYS